MNNFVDHVGRTEIVEPATKSIELVPAMSQHADYAPDSGFADQDRAPFDLQQWANEIEEFVTDISNELNDIAQSLGDQPNWNPDQLSTGHGFQTDSPQAGKFEMPPTTDADECSGMPVSSSDRLQMLKQRLANRNKPGESGQDD